METIELNGKKYYPKEEVDKQLLESKKVVEYTNKFTVLCKDSCFMDECKILGLGTFIIGGEWVTTRLTLSYLEKVIKCIKEMSFDKKGMDGISLTWAKDKPAIIGRLNEDTGEISGFVIAPRIVN